MTTALQELNALRAQVRTLGSTRPAGWGWMYAEVINLIDTKMEQLDRVGCESSDDIDEGLRA